MVSSSRKSPRKRKQPESNDTVSRYESPVQYFNFAPFDTAIACHKLATANGGTYIPILILDPRGIPSPLAPGIHPASLPKIKERCDAFGISYRNGRSNPEVWLSWKRAYDLWNNYYIEGRVNAKWVQEQLDWVKAERGGPKRGRYLGPNKNVVIKVYEEGKVCFEHELPIPMEGTKWVRSAEKPQLRKIEDGKEKRPTGKKIKKRRQKIVLNKGAYNGPQVQWEEYDTDELKEVPIMKEVLVPVWELVDDISYLSTSVEEEQEADEDVWPTEFPDYDDSENGGFEAMKKYDSERKLDERTNNTVWRPRRVGEEKDEINAIDEQRHRASLEENSDNSFRAITEFEVDGGVDCAIEPFPVLRWVDIYLCHQRGVFRKRKIWDRVTGTVFNMPTQPLIKKTDPDLDKRRLSPRNHTTNIFPLDIRRVRIHDPNADPEPPIANSDEEEVQLEGLEPLQTIRNMAKDDPWWVTKEQQDLRDMPPRRWPIAKGHGRDGELLPWDDWDWRQHQNYDDKGVYRYFATNLQNGLLRINGTVVKEGQIVGPLPEFAIIECPGGQVAFWHGKNGRMYGDEGGLEIEEQRRQWEILRQHTLWKYAGRSAGEVWLEKIIDRLKREEVGSEGDDDDDFWEGIREWKAPTSLPEDLPFQSVVKLKPGKDFDITTALSNPRRPVEGNGEESKTIVIDDNPLTDSQKLRVPYVFPSPEDEIKHLAITNVEFGKKIREIIKNPTRQPQGEAFWPGTAKQRNFPRMGTVRSKVIEETWSKHRETLIRAQKEYVRLMRVELSPKKRAFFADSGKSDDGREAIKRRRLDNVKSPSDSYPAWMSKLSATWEARQRQRDKLKEDDKVERLMQANPELDREDLVKHLRIEKKREADDLELRRKEENKRRKKNKQPEIEAARSYVEALLDSLPKAAPPPTSSPRKESSRTPNTVEITYVPRIVEPTEASPTKKQSATKSAGQKVVDANAGQENKKSPAKTSPAKKPAPGSKPSTPDVITEQYENVPNKQHPNRPVSGSSGGFRVNRRYPTNLEPKKYQQFLEWDKIIETQGALGEAWGVELAASKELTEWFIDYTRYHSPDKMGTPTSTNLQSSLRSNFKARAQAAGLDPDEYAQGEGYESLNDWVEQEVAQQNSPKTSGLYPNLDGGVYTIPGNISQSRRGTRATQQNNAMIAMAERAATIGLEAAARLAGRSVEEHLEFIGKTEEQYFDEELGGLVEITDEDDEAQSNNIFKDNAMWILSMQNFEQQVEYLEENPLPAPKSDNGRVYAEI